MLRTTVLTNPDLLHPCLGRWFISALPVDVPITPWVKFYPLAAAPFIFSHLEQILKPKPPGEPGPTYHWWKSRLFRKHIEHWDQGSYRGRLVAVKCVTAIPGPSLVST